MTSNRSSTGKAKQRPVTAKKGIFIASGVFIFLIAAFFVMRGLSGASASDNASAAQGGDITITKSQITETATFIPYQSGNTNMEIIAVKAPDGTIRTALNTCQVCYDSGRGYYVQEGDTLVCQNCGNRFNISQIEKEKNGCNPVPILEENKTDDGQTITIPADFMKQNAAYFSNWKR